jgi:predicted transcriptional regulator
MPRLKLEPGEETTRVNFKIPASEAEQLKEHARRTGDKGNVSRMLRRLAREDIRRSEKAERRQQK